MAQNEKVRLERFVVSHKAYCSCGAEMEWVAFDTQIHKQPVGVAGKIQYLKPEAVVGYAKFRCPECGKEGTIGIEIFPHEVSIVLERVM
ncbi:MAG: hypothetical protein J7L51_03965 [Desulfurococcales archaeon]|nr:hypothetical protein [Desulfurococcales archaeon]